MVILSKFPPFKGVRDGLLRHLLIIIFQALSRRVPRHLFVRLHVKGVDVATPSRLSQRDQNPCQLSKWKFRTGHTYCIVQICTTAQTQLTCGVWNLVYSVHVKSYLRIDTNDAMVEWRKFLISWRTTNKIEIAPIQQKTHASVLNYVPKIWPVIRFSQNQFFRNTVRRRKMSYLSSIY
jgi:hypothetical protein